MAQGPPGGVIGILGGIVAIGLIIGVAVTVFMVHRRQQKTRTETDNDLTDLPPAHKPAPPPPKKKNSDMKGHLTSDDIQVVHLDKDEEMQKLPLQPPYYDMAPSESTPFTDKPMEIRYTDAVWGQQNSGHKDCDVQYAELDTAALASSPSPRSSAHTGPGDLVEYATIQPSSH
ncbi:putative poliovirus receptor-related protein 1 [Scophthalmus maximus]|uniref:Putative poliovirus receptor-related protein 1 n=2 Tax=Scophthalmus maximus TaxID=52904 RepID=A0A2U9B3Z6_SCOMX|nr:putative poliovirus receptor-related protein 1 [Scophthalmus maximus]